MKFVRFKLIILALLALWGHDSYSASDYDEAECDEGPCSWTAPGYGGSVSLLTPKTLGVGAAFGLVNHTNTMGYTFYDLHGGYDFGEAETWWIEADGGSIGILSFRAGVGAYKHGLQASLYFGMMAGFAVFRYRNPGEFITGFQFFLIE